MNNDEWEGVKIGVFITIVFAMVLTAIIFVSYISGYDHGQLQIQERCQGRYHEFNIGDKYYSCAEVK